MITCPNCGKSHYVQHYSTCTAMYFPPIYKDGVNQNPDGNTTTTYCTCCSCNHNFHYSMQYEEIQDIIDDGEIMKSVPLDASLTIPTATEPLTMEDATIPSSTFENAVAIPSEKDIKRVEEKIDKLTEKFNILVEKVEGILRGT